MAAGLKVTAALLAGLVVASSTGCRRTLGVSRSEAKKSVAGVASLSVVPASAVQEIQSAVRADWVALGRNIFFDSSLSEPAGTGCASCHEPGKALSGSNGSTIGVPRGSRPGHFARRSSPSLLYLGQLPKFHLELEDEDAHAPTPLGGLFWDGRVDSVAELIRQPLLNPDEMNNRDDASVAQKVLRAPYGHAVEERLDKLRGPERVVQIVGQALEAKALAKTGPPKLRAGARFQPKRSPSRILEGTLIMPSAHHGHARSHPARLNELSPAPHNHGPGIKSVMPSSVTRRRLGAPQGRRHLRQPPEKLQDLATSWVWGRTPSQIRLS